MGVGVEVGAGVGVGVWVGAIVSVIVAVDVGILAELELPGPKNASIIPIAARYMIINIKRII
ncbi:MAG: hypothetical protein WC562_03535 [Dehalococcoidia bacterium]